MKETSLYYRSSFSKMIARGWTVIPWKPGQPNQQEVFDWLRNNGDGKFYYCAEPNKLNFSIVIENPDSVELFKRKFGVE